VTSKLRTFAVTIVATITGIFNAVMNRGESAIELKPGDAAPDFSLAGSDGRTYSLEDLGGHIVVLAWFPKAFTGG
jgi:thioredoxin-dependent peroxiredoxin